MLERQTEVFIFNSRWLLAPFYVGLVFTLLILLAKFTQKFAVMLTEIWAMEGTKLVLPILSLVDLVLVANLLLIIIFSGYENFVSKIDIARGHEDRPEWMGNVDYSSLKIKVIGSIVAISSIDLLKIFFDIKHVEKDDVMWLVIIHLTFVLSGVLFALMEKLMHNSHNAEHQEQDNTRHENEAHHAAKEKEVIAHG